MFDSQVLAFTIVAAALTVSPGPDTMLVVRNVLRGGRLDGVVTTLGICFGLFVHATLSALGVSIILMHSATAFQTVKLAGVKSLYGAWRAPTLPGGGSMHMTGDTANPSQCLMEGFLTNLLNPKVAVFYLAFLPQFIGPHDPVLAKSILLAGIHFVQGILWLVALSIMLHQTRRYILGSALRRWLDGICGVILVGLGARLLLEKQ
jgi:threonine/homoserine/homoserine lactone efflux protein